jgi:hypothetical protein
MAKRATITVCGTTYKTKKELIEAVRSVLYRYQPGEFLDDGDFDLLFDLLHRHPSAKEKIGCGVISIGVHLTEWSNQGFFLLRQDGSRTDFSFLHCISPKSPLADFKSAARVEVFTQIRDFKKSAFGGQMLFRCELTGEEVEYGNAHVDHVTPITFDRLIFDFMDQFGVDPNTVQIGGFGDGEMEKSIADKTIAEAWKKFHKENAILRVISAKANLSIAKRQPGARP